MKLTVFLIVLFLNIYSDFCTPIATINSDQTDLKDDLISNAQLLLSRVGDIVAQLEQQNRTEEANSINETAVYTKHMVEALNAATNETEFNELLIILSETEELLLKLFERAGQPAFDYEELRLALMIYGEQVIIRANHELENLSKQNKTHSVLLIENNINLIYQTVNELRNASQILVVSENEILLTRHVTQLEEDLYDLGVGWELDSVRLIQIERANSLAIQANAVIEKLKTDEQLEERRRNTIIDELEQQILYITSISEQLKNATDNQTIAGLELKLSEMEHYVEIKLVFLGIKTVSRQEKQQLLHEIVELYAIVLLQMRKWNNEEKNIEAYVLNHQYVFLRDLELAVKNTVFPLDFIAFESRFREILHKVNDELKKFGV